MASSFVQRGSSLLVMLAVLGGGSHGVESSSRAAWTVGSDDVAFAILELVSRGRHPLTSEPLAPVDRVQLAALYAGGSYGPLWTDAHGRPTPGAEEAIDTLLAAAAEGLDAQDYHASALHATMAHRGEPRRAADVAALDAAVSLSTLQYLRHVHHGRVDPRAIGFHISVPADVHDFPAELRRAIHENRVRRTMAEAAPPWALYRSLRAMLARYRPLISEPPLALASQTVRTGDRFPDAAPLLRRLRALGDLPLTSGLAGDGVYDTVLTEGVKRFQMRHGLEPDGILGASTRAALSVPLAWRARQIELALERLRWLPHLGPDRVVAVNIPMFQLWAWNTATPGSLPVVHMNAIVGRALATETPVFADEMTDITFRPYWNVPSSIVQGEIVPAMRRNPDYLEQHAMEVVSVSPLRVRQRPGPRNALGLIKFEFPNDLSVYMHDTPAPELFSRSRRDFSHGCVRVEDPIGLADWALDGQDGWTRARIVGAMHGTESLTVKLARPVQVIMFYVTAVVTPEDGVLHFAADIYRHDERLDRALTSRIAASHGG